MTTSEIMQLVIGCAPSVIAILTFIGVVFKVCHEFAKLKQTVADMRSVKEVNTKIADLVQENYELKTQLNEVLRKIDHVRRD